MLFSNKRIAVFAFLMFLLSPAVQAQQSFLQFEAVNFSQVNITDVKLNY